VLEAMMGKTIHPVFEVPTGFSRGTEMTESAEGAPVGIGQEVTAEVPYFRCGPENANPPWERAGQEARNVLRAHKTQSDPSMEEHYHADP